MHGHFWWVRVAISGAFLVIAAIRLYYFIKRGR
jgi:hypothetical protein